MIRTSTRDRLVAADAREGLLLDYLQELDLEPHRQLADLVEKQGALVGVLEATRLLLHRPGERSALVAEELALEQVLGQARRS